MVWLPSVTEVARAGLPSLSQIQQEAVYKHLESLRPGYKDSLTHRGVMAVRGGKGLRWIVWMSTGSPIGVGIIGVYSQDFQLMSVRETNPIEDIGLRRLKGIGETLIVREATAVGTGLRKHRLYLFDIENLDKPFWSGEVESWLEGLDGRNQGHLIHHAVLLFDLDDDGTDELIDIISEQSGTDVDSFIFAERICGCKVFSFDPESREYRVQTKMQLDLLHPINY